MSERLVRVSPAPPPVAVAVVVAAAVFVGATGVLGRFVDLRPERPSVLPTPVPTTARAIARPGAGDSPIVLITPTPGILRFRTTEIAVAGLARPGIELIRANVRIVSRSIGVAVLPVRADGRFAGRISIVPPHGRTTATLDVRDVANPTVTVRTEFPLEGGSLILIDGPSTYRGGIRDDRITLDGLVYGPVRRVRVVLTDAAARLASEAWATVPAPPPGRRGLLEPRRFRVVLALPAERPLGLGRLHVIGLDPRDGGEAAHVDVNVRILPGR